VFAIDLYLVKAMFEKGASDMARFKEEALPTKVVFDGCFPDIHDAEVKLVLVVVDEFSSLRTEAVVNGDGPEQEMRVEKQFHRAGSSVLP
jgi:hypothetical protein